MQTYSTRDGDTLDWICWRYYGRTQDAVEAVLEANMGLAELGPVYDAGLTIRLPALPTAPPQDVIRLWD
jgi:phage tail protein X